LNQQQAPAAFAIQVIDHPRLGRATTVSHGDEYFLRMPGDLYREPAAGLSARGVLKCVAAQFGGNTEHVVAS